jgi:hypothetical protein
MRGRVTVGMEGEGEERRDGILSFLERIEWRWRAWASMYWNMPFLYRRLRFRARN